jgi:hypothetical protein
MTWGVEPQDDQTQGSAGKAASQATGPTAPEVPASVTPLPDGIHRLPETPASLPTPGNADLPGNSQATDEMAYPDTGRSPSPSTPPTPKRQTPKPRAEDYWHDPDTLIENLGSLASSGRAGKWVTDVLQQIRALGPAVGGGSKASTAILRRLTMLDHEVPELAAQIPDPALSHKLHKVGFALGRRIGVWQQVVDLRMHETPGIASPQRDAKKLTKCLAQIEIITGDSPEGQAWRDYLMIDALKQCAARQSSPSESRSREIVRQALIHLGETPLAPEQQRFIASEPVAALRAELWRWAAEPVSIAALLGHVERYERTGLPSDARRLALDCLSLSASPVEDHRRLADYIDSHYRYANFRVAVTEKLINDLIPERSLEYAQVNDRVLGRPVVGESLMASELAVEMRPDPKHVRLALKVTGEIDALTTVDAGLARIHNDSRSYYVARKPLEVDIDGISLYPVDIEVHNDSRVSGVDTALNPIPGLGYLLRNAVKAGADQSKSAAEAEVKQKVADKARQRIDDETRKELSGVVDQLNQRVFDPLNSLMLDPQLIDAETTEKRFTMGLLLGGEDQLGSHTPRPWALSDSLVSVQIHESVLNNGIQRLQLAGQTFTLPQLSKHVAERLNCPAPWPTNPENDDVTITFAQRDPIVVRCQDGQVVLTLSFARLSKPPRKWTNFQIRAFYRPEAHGRSAELVREGVIHLIGTMGKPLSTGSQFALRGIFSHAFSKKIPWQLTPDRFVKEPKLKDTEITQFVIDDGWIGLALGPKPPAPMTARRPRSTAQRETQ